jgi:hypothetical protein
MLKSGLFSQLTGLIRMTMRTLSCGTQEQRRREEQARKAAAKAAAYARRLDDLAAEGEAPWKQVDEMIATKKTSEYDRAVALLRDLQALARRQGEEAALAKRVLDLRAQ